MMITTMFHLVNNNRNQYDNNVDIDDDNNISPGQY